MKTQGKQACSINCKTMKIGVASTHCSYYVKADIDFTNINRMLSTSNSNTHSNSCICGQINPQLVDVHVSKLPFIVDSLRKKSNNASFGILAALCLSLVACQESTKPHPEQHKQAITKHVSSSIANLKPTKKKTDSTEKKKKQIIKVVPEIISVISVLPDPEPIDPMQYPEVPIIDVPIIQPQQPTDSVYQFPTKTAEFPGGMDQLFQYIQKNMKYPENAKELGLQGTVFIEFVVRKSGEIDNIKLLRGIKGGQELDREAIRIVKTMPKWNPGAVNGIPVSTMMRLPIKFRLD